MSFLRSQTRFHETVLKRTCLSPQSTPSILRLPNPAKTHEILHLNNSFFEFYLGAICSATAVGAAVVHYQRLLPKAPEEQKERIQEGKLSATK